MHLLNYLLEYNRYMNIFGIITIFSIAYLFSHNRNAIKPKIVLRGLLLQFLCAYFTLNTTVGSKILEYVAGGVSKLYNFADEGIGFVFGDLSNASQPWGFIFGIKVLPIIIFFSAFTSILFYIGIIQACVYAVSKTIRPLLHTTGPETLCAVANAFLGQTEAPLLIRHYLKNMTRSEMFVVMVSGMATISGSLLVVLVAMGLPAKHLLAASIMGIPASITIAKILLPEMEKSISSKDKVDTVQKESNILEAIATGTSDGMMLALNVGAMLISFLSLIAMLNYMLFLVISCFNSLLFSLSCSYQFSTVTIEYIFGILFSPFAYLMGFAGQEAITVGSLLGTKVAVNEVVAFGNMQQLSLSARTVAILTYGLCGFSNFSCIGIQIGGIGSLVPAKRKILAELGMYAVLGGMLSNMLSAMIAGLFL